MCQEEIEKVARFNVKGISFAYWIQNDQKLLVDFDLTKTNIDSISTALARWGMIQRGILQILRHTMFCLIVADTDKTI